jgi:hypothetical protein
MRYASIAAGMLVIASTCASAQDKLTKPAGTGKPEIMRDLPKDRKSLRTDGGPKVFKESVGKPVTGKNTTPVRAGAEEKKVIPKRVNTKGGQTEEEIYIGMKRTTGDATTGPGDAFDKKPKLVPGTKARGSSDEGGDIEDLEIQR